MHIHGNTKDETGNRYGRLTVLEYAGPGSGRQGATWLCACDCGKTTTVLGKYLRTGRIKSCSPSRGRPRLPRGEAAFNAVIGRMKRQARERGYEWALCKEDIRLLTQQACYYCGTTASSMRTSQSASGDCVYSGLDRVDNTKGYALENVVPCCHRCNRAKGDMSPIEFAEWVRTVYGRLQRIENSSRFLNNGGETC